MTAAHVVCEKGNETPLSLDKLSIQFRLLDGGTVKIEAKTVYVHHDYNIELDSKGHVKTLVNDIAIIELETEAPGDADRYQIYRDHDEIGKLVTHVGYGSTGTGEEGSTETDYIARYGDNTYGRLSVDDVLEYDFDNGTPENDKIGDNTGVGAREVMIAPGDSGGPGFIDGKIAGVHSSVEMFEKPPIWGKIAGDTRVSQYAPWIDGIISGSTFCGTESNDIRSMGDEANYMYGYGGNDFLSGGGGNDTIDGGNGSDTLRGREGDDLILGGAGNDAISGQWGNDTIDGGPGSDTVQFMGNFADYAITLKKDGKTFAIIDRDGTDQITNVEKFQFADRTLQAGDACTTVYGSYRDEYLYGNDLDNQLIGNGGHDVLEGKKGNDTLDGGNGQDTAIFIGNRNQYTITQHPDGSITLADQVSGRDGTDLTIKVEHYKFADGEWDAQSLIGGGGGGDDLVYTGRSVKKMFFGHTSGEWYN
ncbi:MAG: trypsin-like serine protease, partial [Pelodictyon phaeoclathratiforme]